MENKDNNREWVETAKENASKINSKLNDMTPVDGEFLWHGAMNRQDLKDFWENVKSVNVMFRELKLLKEDREKLWEKLDSICKRAKDKQQRANDSRNNKSSQWYKSIMSDVESADTGWPWNPETDVLKEKGQILKRAGQTLSAHKQEMTTEHKSAIFDRINAVRKNHDAHWAAIKERGAEKRRDFERKVRENLEKNYDRLRKAKDALARAESHASKLRDDISGAWNDKFKDQAYGWLSEEERKISDIEESIKRIEDWILEDEVKLR